VKTRIIQTSFWKDCKVQEMSLYAQHLFIYLLTSDHIGLTGAFELPDQYMLLEGKLTEYQLDQAKTELTKFGRASFKDGWVIITNASKYNNYLNSPKTAIAYKRELDLIPTKIKELIDSSMDSSIDTAYIVPKTINHKTKTIKQKEELSERMKAVLKELGDDTFVPTQRTINLIEKDFGKYIIMPSIKALADHNEEKGKQVKTKAIRTWLENDLKWGKLEKRDK